MSAPLRARLKPATKSGLLPEKTGLARELLSESIDCRVEEYPSRRRPGDRSSDNGPYLGETWGEKRRKPPSANDVASDGRTHDVNQEMLAKEYRRGLRVRGNRSFYSQSLDFLFGSK